RDLFFLAIRVGGGVACDGRNQFFDGVLAGSCDFAVWLSEADVTNVNLLARGIIGKYNLAQLLRACIVLNARFHGNVALAGPVIFKASSAEILLDHKRLARMLGPLLRGNCRFGFRASHWAETFLRTRGCRQD